MIYRDDGAVLRERARALEAELAEASRQLAATHAASARAADLEAALADTRSELDRVRAARAGGPARSAAAFDAAQRARLALPIGALALGLVGLSALSGLALRSAGHPTTAQIADRNATLAGLVAEVGGVERPPEALLPPPLVAPGEHGRRWLGRLREAGDDPEPWPRYVPFRGGAPPRSIDGAPLPAGTPCAVDVALSAQSSELRVRRVQVTCGYTILYRSSAERLADARVIEEVGPTPGTYRDAFTYRDMGSSLAHLPGVSIDTAAGTVIVWNEAAGEKTRATVDLATDGGVHAGPPLVAHDALELTESDLVESPTGSLLPRPAGGRR